MSPSTRCALPAAALLLLVGCGTADDPDVSAGADRALTAPLMTADGEEVGTLELAFTGDGASLRVTAQGLPPGYHGLHVHTTGRCEPDSPDPADAARTGDFLSAGGHLAEQGQSHGDHDGDLPSLLVRADGTASLSVTSDRLTREAVLDDDGAALLVHVGPDNFANVPERYAPTLDDTTLKTGDAGGRLACAVLGS